MIIMDGFERINFENEIKTNDFEVKYTTSINSLRNDQKQKMKMKLKKIKSIFY